MVYFVIFLLFLVFIFCTIVLPGAVGFGARYLGVQEVIGNNSIVRFLWESGVGTLLTFSVLYYHNNHVVKNRGFISLVDDHKISIIALFSIAGSYVLGLIGASLCLTSQIPVLSILATAVIASIFAFRLKN